MLCYTIPVQLTLMVPYQGCDWPLTKKARLKFRQKCSLQQRAAQKIELCALNTYLFSPQQIKNVSTIASLKYSAIKQTL